MRTSGVMRRAVTAAVAVGGLIAVGALVANSSLVSAGATASPGASVAAGLPASLPLASGTGSGHQISPTYRISPNNGGGRGSGGGPGGWGGYGGFGGRYGGIGGGGAVLSVTGVSGSNTINATARAGQPVTVTVSATTAYTEAGQSVDLSAVHTGSTIAVQGTRTGPSTLSATSVIILLPTVSGVVTGVNGTTFTLTSEDGISRTITTSSSTQYQEAGASTTLAAVVMGSAVTVEGTTNSDSTFGAVRVTIRLPQVVGRVTSVGSSSYTLAGRFGTTYTVDTTTSTTYVTPNGTSTSATSVMSGTIILAQGTLSTDGKTLTAQRIVVVTSGNASTGGGSFGFGGRGGHGGRHGRFGAGSGQGFGFPSSGTGSPTTGSPGAGIGAWGQAPSTSGSTNGSPTI